MLLFKEMLFESTLFYYKKQIIKSGDKNTFVKLQPIGMWVRKQIVTLAGRKDGSEGEGVSLPLPMWGDKKNTLYFKGV